MTVKKTLPANTGKKAVVGGKPSAKPSGKVAVRGKAEQPSRLAKFESKYSKIPQRKHDPKQEFSVKIVAARAPVQVIGYLLKVEGDMLTVSHTKPRSSKPTVSLFKASDVIQFTGAIGERVEMTVMLQEVLKEVKRATLETRNGALVITDLQTHDVMTFNTSNTDGFTVRTSLID